jgi:hypothetical protein
MLCERRDLRRSRKQVDELGKLHGLYSVNLIVCRLGGSDASIRFQAVMVREKGRASTLRPVLAFTECCTGPAGIAKNASA